MVRHIVMMKLKNFSDAEKTKEILLSMEGKVGMIESIEVNIDMLRSDRSYDVMLDVTVKDFETLEAYQNDPYHCEVVKKFIHEARTGSVAFDYEF